MAILVGCLCATVNWTGDQAFDIEE